MKTEKLVLVQKELDILTKHFKAAKLSEHNRTQLI